MTPKVVLFPLRSLDLHNLHVLWVQLDNYAMSWLVCFLETLQESDVPLRTNLTVRETLKTECSKVITDTITHTHARAQCTYDWDNIGHHLGLCACLRIERVVGGVCHEAQLVLRVAVVPHVCSVVAMNTAIRVELGFLVAKGSAILAAGQREAIFCIGV